MIEETLLRQTTSQASHVWPSQFCGVCRRYFKCQYQERIWLYLENYKQILSKAVSMIINRTKLNSVFLLRFIILIHMQKFDYLIAHISLEYIENLYSKLHYRNLNMIFKKRALQCDTVREVTHLQIQIQ